MTFDDVVALAGFVGVFYLVIRDYLRRVSYVDVATVTGHLAERLLYDYPDAREISKEGAMLYARNQYLQMCISFGLPRGAVDNVAAGVWEIIEAAQEAQPQKAVKEFSFYG